MPEPATIIAAVALAVTAGVGAYNAYASQDYQHQQLEHQAEALRQQGILTQEEKRLAEARINALEKNLYGTPTDAPDSSSHTTEAATGKTGPPSFDLITLAMYGAGLWLGWIILKAIRKWL